MIINAPVDLDNAAKTAKVHKERSRPARVEFGPWTAKSIDNSEIDAKL